MADINYPIANKQELDNLKQEVTSHKEDYATQIGTVANLTTTSKVVVGAINEVNTNKANKVQEAWITPTLLNGWVVVASSPIRYRKNNFGNVEIRGRVSGGVLSTMAFQLPIGYRPPIDILGFPINSNHTAGNCYIDFSGGLYIVNGATTNVNLNISFSTI